MKRLKQKIALIFVVFLTTMSHAQNKELLYDELNYNDGICKKNIIGTPVEILKSTWTDTSCFHRKQPISMLSFVHKNHNYSFYIDYNLENSIIDSINLWIENHYIVEISVLFFQHCSETYVLDDMFYPIGIILHIHPLSKDVMKPSNN